MAKVGFVGLGKMGMAMCRNLLKAGHSVRVYDINPEPIKMLAKEGAIAASAAADVAEGADFVVTMLPAGPEVEDALFGSGNLAKHIQPDKTLYIDMSSIGAVATDAISDRLRKMKIRMVDAPVGGTSAAAEKGTLSILAGGDLADVERAAPVFDAVGAKTIYCGSNGQGSRTKVVNNFMSTALNALTAETLALAEASGLDTKRTVEVLKGTTAGYGFLLQGAYERKVLSGDLSPEFGLALASKDLNLAVQYAASLNVPLCVGAAASQVYARARAEGRGGQDWSSLLETTRLAAGLAPKYR
jgi:4-hydroxybutyrate dehydrogenase/sulfolactaldehyde 3-reductase